MSDQEDRLVYPGSGLVLPPKPPAESEPVAREGSFVPVDRGDCKPPPPGTCRVHISTISESEEPDAKA